MRSGALRSDKSSKIQQHRDPNTVALEIGTY